MSEEKPSWDDAFGARLLNAVVLVGITREGPEGTTREEFFGTVKQADAAGIQLRLDGSRSGQNYRLPPDPRAFFPAQPGSYRLRSTGEVVKNPDFTAAWTIVSNAD